MIASLLIWKTKLSSRLVQLRRASAAKGVMRGIQYPIDSNQDYM